MSKISGLLKDKAIRKWAIAVIAVIVVGLLARGVPSPRSSDTSANNKEAKVVSLNVAQTIEASGSLEAQPSVTLNWKTSGVVKSVNVKPGDFVKKDDMLLTLEPSSTSADIVLAQSDLVYRKIDLEDLLKSNTDFAQAAVDLDSTKEDYDDAVSYWKYLQNEKKIPQTETRLYLFQTPKGYQYFYKIKSYKSPADEDDLTDAKNDMELKKAKYEDAQRTYDRLKDGPNAQYVLAAQAKVDAAQATVNMLSIIAPFDGEVLSVENRVGDVVTAGDLSVNVADLNHLYVEMQVDETDIASVKLGNEVTATLDAVPDVTLTGKVTAINPVGEVISGLVKYSVRVDLDKVKDDIFLPLGTTANVVIQVQEPTATLAVPIAAIQNDDNGEYVWVLQNDGSTKRVDIVSGTIVGDLVAATGDLKEGDRLQLQRDNSLQAPGPFGGGN